VDKVCFLFLDTLDGLIDDFLACVWVKPAKFSCRRFAVSSLVRLVILLVVLWVIAATLRVYPEQLTYFNEGAGGSDNGWRCLAGSSVDWGQCRTVVPTLLKDRGYAVRSVSVPDLLRAETCWFLNEEFDVLRQEAPASAANCIAIACSVNLVTDSERFFEHVSSFQSTDVSAEQWKLIHPTTALIVRSRKP